MFGGRLECSGDPIAETTILRFGEGHYRIKFGEYEVVNFE